MTKTQTPQKPQPIASKTMSADGVKADLSKLVATISTALKLVEKGNLVDLSALETKTQKVCDAALALPAAESRPLLPLMKGIIAGLDALESALEKKFGPAKRPGVSAAASAYAKAQTGA